jgi:TonB family protein
VSYLGRRQRLDPLLFVGIAVSVVLHGGMAVAIVFDRSGADKPPTEPPRDFVVAKMVRLGRKRPPNWLPVIPALPAAGPRAGIRLSHDAQAAAAKKKAEERRARVEEAKVFRRADTLAKVFAEAQKELDQEGDPRGSPTGTATEASPGDEYATACAEAIQAVWTVPPAILLPDATLARLTAQVRVIIDGRGKVYDAKVKEPSRNRYFDASLKDALGRLKNLPAPPKGLMKDYPRVGIILLFEGKDLKR